MSTLHHFSSLLNPTKLFVLGDFGDCYVGAHIKDLASDYCFYTGMPRSIVDSPVGGIP